MKLHILFPLLALLGTTLAEQSTTLTFLAEYEDEQQEDYIQLTLSVKAQGQSLVDTMSEASKVAEQIKTIATEFCQAHTKKKAECKDIVEIGNYNINPSYQVVKRQSKFMGFQVQHQVTIKVLAVDHISDLADTILKEPDTKILSFEWKPLEEVNSDEAAVKQGTAQGQELCDEIGMHLNKINNVEEMTQEATEQVAVYRFSIDCLPGRKASKKTESEDDKKSKSDKQKSDKQNKDKEDQKQKQKKADKKQKGDDKAQEKKEKSDDKKQKTDDRKEKADDKKQKKQNKKDQL